MLQVKARIIENKELLPETYYRLSLKTPPIARLAKPGQFVHLRVNEEIFPLLRRPFSIHSVHKENIQILYKVAGAGTGILSRRKKDELLDVIGPLGNGYRLPDKRTKVILVAGGAGVASLCFLSQRLASCPAVLIGGRSKRDILGRDKFKRLKTKIKISTEDGSLGKKGLVTDLLQELLPTPHSPLPTVIYACGPMRMLKETAKIAERHRALCYVSLEEFIVCGVGACQGCAVRTKNGYKRVCKDGPVFDSKEIIW